MRFVLYDDEDMEPITVLNLKGMTARDLLAQGGRWRIPAPPGLLSPSHEPSHLFVAPKVVEIWFERFIRRDRESLMAFTKAADLAMLLTPDWLPGQRGAVEYLQSQNDGLTRMLMKAFFA